PNKIRFESSEGFRSSFGWCALESSCYVPIYLLCSHLSRSIRFGEKAGLRQRTPNPGRTAAALSGADHGGSTHARNSPDSDLIYQVTEIGAGNRQLRDPRSERAA